jgi:hypothetical protein
MGLCVGDRRDVGLRLRQFVAQVAQHLGDPAEDSAVGHEFGKGANFGFEVVSVFRKVASKRRNLVHHDRSKSRDDKEGDKYREATAVTFPIFALMISLNLRD